MICLSQSGKSRQCQIANGAGDGHTQQHSWREKAPTSTYSACRDTNGGTRGPMEEIWSLSKGISAQRQIVRNQFPLNYFMVGKINLTFMRVSWIQKTIYLDFHYGQRSCPGLIESIVHQSNLRWGEATKERYLSPSEGGRDLSNTQLAFFPLAVFCFFLAHFSVFRYI